MTSISSGWPPVSIMWANSSLRWSGTIGPAEALSWTNGTISWQDGLFRGSGGNLVGEREAPVLDGTDAVADVELGAGSSGLVGTLVVLRSCMRRLAR